MVQAVASDRFGIGYSGIGYKTADVRAVPLASKTGGACEDAVSDNAYSGKYPLTRFLYVYVGKQPGAAMDPVRAQFLRYVLSQEGQEAVVKDGYLPLTAKLIADERKKLGIE